MRDRRNAVAGTVAPLTKPPRSRLSYPGWAPPQKPRFLPGARSRAPNGGGCPNSAKTAAGGFRQSIKRKLRQSVSLTAQKRSEAEVVVKAAQGGYVRHAAAKSFNPDAQVHVTSNPGQLPRQVS
jgi:hypothetical protein